MSRLSLSLLVLIALAAPSFAAGPDVIPSGKQPNDSRLAPPKDLDGYFPFTPSKSVEDWSRRAEQVRLQILVSQGIYPQPTKCPLNAVIHGKVERDGFTVERVYFESMPGFYVTGSLYRPVGKSGKLPVVLRPDGHFSNGRFHDAGLKAVQQEIVNGAERFEDGGRSPVQACSMQLARMGCLVFHYDMLGYADSVQLSFQLAHRFEKQRPEMNKETDWGLYSPQAESRLQSIMGLQTWNSIRALDFLETLPDADMTRVGVTGASGGGTQTMLIAAIDPRITVAAPAVMVSTAMQGGCTCENASLLRVGTGNVEFAALFAPKPQLCLSADDWTKEMPTKGFPELQQHYKLLGAEKNVKHRPLLHFGHNYNYVSRSSIYAWFNQHLKLGLPEPVIEGDFKRLSVEEQTVWDATHPKPESGDAFERKLCKWWNDDAQLQLLKMAGQPQYAQTLRSAWQVICDVRPASDGASLPSAKDLSYEQTVKEERDGYIEMAGLLKNKAEQSELPVAFLYPKDWNGTVVVWLSNNGKAGLYGDDGKPTAAVAKLLNSGASIMSADLIYQGEFGGIEKSPVVKNPREFAGYTFGYNRTIFANRVHDVLNLLAYVRSHEKMPKQVCLVALDETAPIAAAARLLSENKVDRTALDTRGFRFAKVDDYRSASFLPGSAKYGDLPGLLAASEPSGLWIAGETSESLKGVVAAYSAKKDALSIYDGAKEKAGEAAAEWLAK
jgi:hypothetical protein